MTRNVDRDRSDPFWPGDLDWHQMSPLEVRGRSTPRPRNRPRIRAQTGRPRPCRCTRRRVGDVPFQAGSPPDRMVRRVADLVPKFRAVVLTPETTVVTALYIRAPADSVDTPSITVKLMPIPDQGQHTLTNR